MVSEMEFIEPGPKTLTNMRANGVCRPLVY